MISLPKYRQITVRLSSWTASQLRRVRRVFFLLPENTRTVYGNAITSNIHRRKAEANYIGLNCTTANSVGLPGWWQRRLERLNFQMSFFISVTRGRRSKFFFSTVHRKQTMREMKMLWNFSVRMCRKLTSWGLARYLARWNWVVKKNYQIENHKNIQVPTDMTVFHIRINRKL